MPELLSALDVALVPLKRHPLFTGVLPSKIFVAMGAAVPVVGSVGGEARDVIVKSLGGICVEPENASQIAEAVLQLYRDPELRRSLGENGRRYVTKHFNRRDVARKFEQLLLASCSPATAGPLSLNTEAQMTAASATSGSLARGSSYERGQTFSECAYVLRIQEAPAGSPL